MNVDVAPLPGPDTQGPTSVASTCRGPHCDGRGTVAEILRDVPDICSATERHCRMCDAFVTPYGM